MSNSNPPEPKKIRKDNNENTQESPIINSFLSKLNSLSPNNNLNSPVTTNLSSKFNASPHTPNIADYFSSTDVQQFPQIKQTDNVNNDEFSISSNLLERFNDENKSQSPSKQSKKKLPNTQLIELLNVDNIYHLNEDINNIYDFNKNTKISGQQAIIYLNVTKKINDEKKYVVKEFKGNNINIFNKEVNRLYLLKTKCLENNNCDYFVNYVNSYSCNIMIDKTINKTMKNNYIVFEDAGTTLNELTNFTDSNINSIKNQLLTAVNALHSMGIFHGDIKPANIALTKVNNEYKLKIIDFGEASLLSEKISRWPNNQNYEGFINKENKLIKSSGWDDGLEPTTIENKKKVELAVANTIIEQLKKSSTSNNAKQKYLKYKLKYLELKKTL
jgi:hypothetical protein